MLEITAADIFYRAILNNVNTDYALLDKRVDPEVAYLAYRGEKYKVIFEKLSGDYVLP